MSNLSDKDIDRLSREAADSYEPDTSSLSWTRLEQKLKEQMPERPPDGFRIGRINPYIWGPAVILFAGASFFFIKKNIYSKDSTLTNQETVKAFPSNSGNEKPANGNTVYLDSLSTSDDAAAGVDNNTTLPKSSSPSGGATAGDIKSSPSKEMAASNQPPTLTNSGRDADVIKPSGIAEGRGGKISKSEAENKSIGKSDAGLKVPPPAVTIAGVGTASNGSSVANSNQPYLSNDPTERPADRTAFILPAVSSEKTPVKVTQNDSLLNRISQSGIPTPHKSLRINRSLNIGFAFGPDYTDAGGITNDELGNNIGITVGYYLTNKLSINTGIFYSNKFYWSPGHGTPNQPWSNYAGGTGIVGSNAAPPAIENVNGACNMYELPLTLRYDFAHDEKTKFFVNGGLSSYFMIKQTYINFFHSANRPVAYKTVDDEQVNYWFDVAAFSFGLETEIGKGFSFQAEPFFRIPLKDMGSQNLRLNTYGLMLSFRYTPVLSRSKK